jgi:hypothetical protein
LVKIDPNQKTVKGKFETEDEFRARGGMEFVERFVVVKIQTDNEKQCKTSYDHASDLYKIKNCAIFSD